MKKTPFTLHLALEYCNSSSSQQYNNRLKYYHFSVQSDRPGPQKNLLGLKIHVYTLESYFQSLQQIREIKNLEISSESSIIESSEEDNKNKDQQNIQQMQRLLRQKSEGVIQEMQVNDEQKDVQQQNLNNTLEKNLTDFMQFNQDYKNLSEDTKFRLNCSFTKLFQKNVQWIFWRYYEWLKQKFFCYQLIVNNEKGTLLQNSKQIYHSIPPIQGTETYFNEEYNKLKTYCFNEGLPLFFQTITMNEFDEKTFKNMRGLNYLDLEDFQIVQRLNKVNIRYEELMQNANNFVDYYLFLMKHYKKVIKNKFNNQLNPHKDFNHYKFGLYGDYKAMVTRIEFQNRGSLHFHQFIFINQNENNLYNECYLQYILGEFSLYNSNFQKDVKFLHKYDLFHHCSLEKCITKDTQTCRFGFPQNITNGQYNTIKGIQNNQRRLKQEDQNVITFYRDTVKFFNSNCQINMCNDENILGYLTKYINKTQQKNKNLTGKESASRENMFDYPENNTIMDQVKKFLDEKQTSLQEAYFAFKQTQIIESSFNVIKIKQQPMTTQISSKVDYFDQITVKNVDEMFEINQISNSWYRYINRPEELELLNFYEYCVTTIFYGKKQKYIMKMKQELMSNILNGAIRNFLVDQNSNIIKIKENSQNKKIIIQTSYLHPSEDYKGINNVYFLQMLQLFWPHRKNSWIQNTFDNYDGYIKAYHNLINSFDYPREDNIQNYYRIKYCKYQEYPLKHYVYQIQLIKLNNKWIQSQNINALMIQKQLFHTFIHKK
ncbi:unnamed protein product [Paramecium sonneborni]|uniref:Helitron helicase-like domain-containing protein n=1 Tax=Paramecium sonneborni TaxID=65129 RepID=A0A8S1RRR4_9CILI|nr:unnamed protein product [Paramecium sonneborni]